MAAHGNVGHLDRSKVDLGDREEGKDASLLLQTAGLWHLQSGPQGPKARLGSGTPRDGEGRLLSLLWHLQGGKH